MPSLFDMFDPRRPQSVLHPENDLQAASSENIKELAWNIDTITSMSRIKARAMGKQLNHVFSDQSNRGETLSKGCRALLDNLGAHQKDGKLAKDWMEYLQDSAERLTLTMDTLRKRGDIFLEHEAAGCPPVLIYDYEVVMDGKDLPHPCNYSLLKILPPKGMQVDDNKRPFIIVDPRAGHGPGIGGFKPDSQVGVALRQHHPVYFVAFRRSPEPGQKIASVTRAEAAFVREVMRRHPNSRKPVITGNCQGGWAVLVLAALNRDLTGPIVINGAPIAPWAGRVGENPMRYNAGVLGGTWVPMFLSDIGGGIFDGAHLVSNFEMLNPGRTLFHKYTDLYRDIDKGDSIFLNFETWWGGYFLLTEQEIRWIVSQLFVGNRLAKNGATIEPGHPIDIKAIRAPIIAFASHGDNITPPQQALNWITETYSDVQEIRIRGQRIIYMVHEQVGHLGIFVSSKIAKREHTEVSSTLGTIEALSPGLYEMVITDIAVEDGEKKFTVDFFERTLDDIRALDDGMIDERPFAAVARFSELQAKLYRALVRPAVQALVTPSSAELSRVMHPKRLERALQSSHNPLMMPFADAAARIKENRHKAAADNPFVAMESLWFDAIGQGIDLWRDLRDTMYEQTFFTIWGTPLARHFGSSYEARRTHTDAEELRSLPEVASALLSVDRGGFPEAVIRMLILLVDQRGNVRADRLERSSRVLTENEPFSSLGAERRALIIYQQTLIVSFEPERAIETLPLLLESHEERVLAMQVAQYIPGPKNEMTPETLAIFERFRTVLDLPELGGDVLEDPLEDAQAQKILARHTSTHAHTAHAADSARRLSTARQAAAQHSEAKSEKPAGKSASPAAPVSAPQHATARSNAASSAAADSSGKTAKPEAGSDKAAKAEPASGKTTKAEPTKAPEAASHSDAGKHSSSDTPHNNHKE